MIWWITILLFFLLANAFYSGTETGVYSISRLHLGMRLRNGDTRAAILHRMIENPERLVATTLVGAMLGIEAVSLSGSIMINELLVVSNADLSPEFLNTLILTPVMFLFADIVPKSVFQANAERLMYPCARALAISQIVFRPFTAVLEYMTAGLRTILPVRDDREENDVQDRKILEQTFRHSSMVLSDFQSRLGLNVLELGEIPVGRFVRPLRSVPFVRRGAAPELMLQVARAARADTLAVLDEDGRLAGVIDVYDFLYAPGAAHNGPPVNQPIELDPSETVLAAILKMRGAGSRVAVIREAGKEALGLVQASYLSRRILRGISR